MHAAIADLGVGIYSFFDAARYIGSTPRELRRWLLGYEYMTPAGVAESAPLWEGQLQGSDIEGLGFRDLLELRFVRAFRDAGVPLKLIRETLKEARVLLNKTYPLTSDGFRTDGKRIFMQVVEANGDKSLIDVVKHQNVIETVVGPSLRRGIEFGKHGAERWYPVSGSKTIVFDPERKFGQPLLTEYDVPTAAIAGAVKAEQGNEARVARMFGVSRAAVRQALAFEARTSRA